MAESKRAGGLYYREDGVAVDADGIEIKGAPKRKDDTPRAEPGAAAVVSMADSIASGIVAGLAALKTAGAKTE